MSKAFLSITAFVILSQVGCGRTATARAAKAHGQSDTGVSYGAAGTADVRSEALDYSGTDARGVPHYFAGRLSDEARTILRDAYGVTAPSHLYISDSTRDGLLKYDPQLKRCASCYVSSYRVGFVSIRRHGESWEDLERRTRTLTRSAFPASLLVSSSSVSAMDPDVQDEVNQMLAAARRAGFAVHVASTYRSPEQEALVMARGDGRTHTLTSLHSYGRALDIRIGDGNFGNPATRRSWIAFRSWVTRFRDDDFRILGKPDQSWDWPHVELPSAKIGFRSVEAAIAAGRACLSKSSARACEFLPHLTQRVVSGTKE